MFSPPRPSNSGAIRSFASLPLLTLPFTRSLFGPRLARPASRSTAYPRSPPQPKKTSKTGCPRPPLALYPDCLLPVPLGPLAHDFRHQRQSAAHSRDVTPQPSFLSDCVQEAPQSCTSHFRPASGVRPRPEKPDRAVTASPKTLPDRKPRKWYGQLQLQHLAACPFDMPLTKHMQATAVYLCFL